MTKPVINLMIDSGAFSAFTQKKEVNIEKYCDFLLYNKERIGPAVNLDVIAPEGPEVAAAKGWENYQYMRNRGIKPMPVFHARENLKWLDLMLDDTDYIGLSGTSLVSPTEHIAWYRLVWTYATDKQGYPLAKFHAFGDTSLFSLLTFPWYSADSATWMIQSGRAARVKLQGKSYQLRSNSIRDSSYVDDNDPLPKKQAWQDEIRTLGLDPDVVMKVIATPSEMAMIRSYLIASDLLRLQEQTRDLVTYKAPSSLIKTRKQEEGGFNRQGPCNVFFVISPAAWYFNLPILASLGITNVLVSYYYLDLAPKNFWEERLVPFLYNPVDFCQRNEKLRKYWDKLQEVLCKREVVAAG